MRMYALAVMHRRTLCENVDSAKIKVPFYKYRYFKHGIDTSHRHTLYWYIDESLHPYFLCQPWRESAIRSSRIFGNALYV